MTNEFLSCAQEASAIEDLHIFLKALVHCLFMRSFVGTIWRSLIIFTPLAVLGALQDGIIGYDDVQIFRIIGVIIVLCFIVYIGTTAGKFIKAVWINKYLLIVGTLEAVTCNQSVRYKSNEKHITSTPYVRITSDTNVTSDWLFVERFALHKLKKDATAAIILVGKYYTIVAV